MHFRLRVQPKNSYGDRSLAGLMAHPALYAKLMWMAANPRPMRGGISPEGTSMLRLSVTARMMTRRQAVARAWSQGCQMAKFDPFFSLDCTRVEGVGVQSKERKGSNFAA